MSQLFALLGLGFILGMRHATDADHVVAVTTITSKDNKFRYSALIGALWGIGHAITVTLIGIPIILFSITIPPRVGLGLEFIVGIMLVVLGVANLTGITERISHHFAPTVHSHTHLCPEGDKHSHLHMHLSKTLPESIHHLGLFQIIRPLIIGFIHGLAGSAAIALLLLSTIKNAQFALFYLFIFHMGVILGMILITTLLGVSVTLIKNKSEKMHKYLVFTSGVLSFVFGIYILYKTGIVDGLFSSQVHWKPQ